MKQWYISWNIWEGPIFCFLWSSLGFLVWDVTLFLLLFNVKLGKKGTCMATWGYDPTGWMGQQVWHPFSQRVFCPKLMKLVVTSIVYWLLLDIILHFHVPCFVCLHRHKIWLKIFGHHKKNPEKTLTWNDPVLLSTSNVKLLMKVKLRNEAILIVLWKNAWNPLQELIHYISWYIDHYHW